MAPVLEVQDLCRRYATPQGEVRALDGVSFALQAGEILGVVGESGCGKSTLARLLVQLERPDGGRLLLGGTEAAGRPGRQDRRKVQIVFQDPVGALNPRKTVGQILRAPLEVHRLGDRRSRAAKVAEYLELVGLPAEAASRYPHEFSGGQRQRICIARALIVGPEIVVCDEPVSALDVSIQTQILKLLADLRQRLGVSIVFISHDISVVNALCDRVLVMYLGMVVEQGTAADVLAAPRHPYARALVSAAPVPDPAAAQARKARRIRLGGEPPTPLNVPPGCRFAPRCPHVQEACRSAIPELRVPDRAAGRLVRCVRAERIDDLEAAIAAAAVAQSGNDRHPTGCGQATTRPAPPRQSGPRHPTGEERQ